jgi:hypothetical protein
MKLTWENRSSRRKTCLSATLSTTNPTWTDPGSNPGLRGGRPTTNRLNHGSAKFMSLRVTHKSHARVTLTSWKFDFLFLKSKWRNASIGQSDAAVGLYSGGPSLMPAACSMFEMPPICSTRDPGTFLLSLGVSEPRGWICHATGLNPLVNTGIS